MRQTRVRSMVEGGLLAAIAIIFAIISVYLPIIGPFVNLLWPVPIILLGVRHGYKWSIMATVVAGVIISMLVHPLQAVSVVVGFGLIGIVLGYAFRMEFSPAKTMLWGSAASLLSKIALLAIGAAIRGSILLLCKAMSWRRLWNKQSKFIGALAWQNKTWLN